MKVFKQLVKVKKNPFFILVIGISTFLFVAVGGSYSLGEVKTIDEMYHAAEPKTVEVILKRVYLDGEVGEERIKETIWSMEDFWAFYEEWTLVDQADDLVIFRQDIDDISPLLKIEGYFGLSEDGFLQIYQGDPNHEQIIQSFFQIDTKKLKSRQHLELVEGIPVKSKENFEEILSVFSDIKVEGI